MKGTLVVAHHAQGPPRNQPNACGNNERKSPLGGSETAQPSQPVLIGSRDRDDQNGPSDKPAEDGETSALDQQATHGRSN